MNDETKTKGMGAIIVYHMLKHRDAYRDSGEAAYIQQHRDRTVRNLKRRASLLGLQLAPAHVTVS